MIMLLVRFPLCLTLLTIYIHDVILSSENGFSVSPWVAEAFVGPRLLINKRVSSSAFSFSVNMHNHHASEENSLEVEKSELQIDWGKKKTIDQKNTLMNNSKSSSRRQWIQKTTTAAVAGIVGWNSNDASFNTPPAMAAETLTLPPSTALTSTTSVPSISNSRYLCDPSVSTWKNVNNGRIIHLVGTAHISPESAQLAGYIVKETRPDAVFVELDAKRVGRAVKSDPADAATSTDNISGNDKTTATTTSTAAPTTSLGTGSMSLAAAGPIEGNPEQERLKKTNPFDFKEKMMRAGSALVGNTIKGLYKKLESEGFSAGEEFVIAVREGLNVGSKIILGDRDVEVTLRHITDALAKTDLKMLMSSDSELEKSMEKLMPQNQMAGMDSSSADTKMSKDQFATYVETMKAKENVKLLMGTLKQSAPELYKALVSERDEFMADGLDRLNQFPLTVAVMGIAHVDGVENTLQQRGWTQEFPSACTLNRS